jgi:DNA-binding MarR family transcriptional regulator
VLRAIAQSPDLSNRRVAAVAGISDEGQASRLLARLRRVGLIESGEPPPGSRGSKSWRVTPAGRELLDEIG